MLPFTAQAKWLLMPTILAIALAFECDDLLEADHEPWWLKWLEGVGLAALMSVCGLLIIRWLAVDRTALYPDGVPLSV